jgi:HK97 family phage major capsid protein
MKKEKLIEKRTALGVAWDKYKAHRDSLGDDQSTWSAEARTKFDKLDDDVNKIEVEIGNLEDGIKREAKDAEREQRFAKTDDKGFRPNAENRGNIDPNAEERNTAFDIFLRSGITALTHEQRSMMAGVDADGGYLITPETFVSALLKEMDDVSVVRSLSTIETLKNAASLGIISLDADLGDWDFTTELQTGNLDPGLKFKKRALAAHPMAKRVKISETLIRKSSKGVQSLVMGRMKYKLGGTLEYNYMLGDGIDKPLGLFVASADGIPLARDIDEDMAQTMVTYDGLISVQGSLKEGYQKNANWLFNRNLLTKIRKLKNGDEYAWSAGLADGTPSQILGKPYKLSDFCPSVCTAGSYVGMYGNFKYYWILDALSMTIKVVDQLYAETNEIGYIGRYEGDAQPVMGEAFSRIKLAD